MSRAKGLEQSEVLRKHVDHAPIADLAQEAVVTTKHKSIAAMIETSSKSADVLFGMLPSAPQPRVSAAPVAAKNATAAIRTPSQKPTIH